MNILKATVRLIGWLSGSMAGIGALLSFFGYLVTAAHVRLLGLDMALFGFNAEFYLQRGGNFVFYVFDALSQRILLPLTVICLIPLTLVMAIDLFPETGRMRTWLKMTKESLLTMLGLQVQWLRIVASLVLILLLFVQLSPSLDDLINPLKISDLLYWANEPDSGRRNKDCFYLALIDQNSNILAGAFFYLLISMLRAGFYLLLISYTTESLKFRAFIIAPFLVIFALYLIFLPMNYGVMRIKNEYPEISFESVKAVNGQQASYFLLNRSDKALVLWDARNQKILLVPQAELGRAYIGRYRPLWQQATNRSCYENSNTELAD